MWCFLFKHNMLLMRGFGWRGAVSIRRKRMIIRTGTLYHRRCTSSCAPNSPPTHVSETTGTYTTFNSCDNFFAVFVKLLCHLSVSPICQYELRCLGLIWCRYQGNDVSGRISDVRFYQPSILRFTSRTLLSFSRKMRETIDHHWLAYSISYLYHRSSPDAVVQPRTFFLTPPQATVL